MKKYIILLLICFAYVSCDSDDSIPEQYVDVTIIPDENFERALIDLGYDDVMDQFVITSNISKIETLDVSGRGIKKLEGIRYFTNLKVLWCERNKLYKLEEISEISGLKVLICNNNSLDSLNISENKYLTTLECNNNVLKWLILNESVQTLSCSFNHLQFLDLSESRQLEELICSENIIRHMDLSNNKKLSLLHCQRNALQTLNLKNLNNDLLADFNATYNPELNCIEVSDLAFCDTYLTDWIDRGSIFSEDCGY